MTFEGDYFEARTPDGKPFLVLARVIRGTVWGSTWVWDPCAVGIDDILQPRCDQRRTVARELWRFPFPIEPLGRRPWRLLAAHVSGRETVSR